MAFSNKLISKRRKHRCGQARVTLNFVFIPKGFLENSRG